MSLNTWSFTPFPPLPATILPNVAFWNATNPANNLTYQIQVSWPFEWSSRNVTNKTALPMYVFDGNALTGTASEAFKRRKPVFPNVKFTRDALYGHSFADLFLLYSLIDNTNNFDTYLSASPALNWNNGSLLDDITTRLRNGIDKPGTLYSSNGTSSESETAAQPAVITYGEIERFPQQKRTETEAVFQSRKNFIQPFRLTEYSREAFDRIKGSGRVRDVVVKEYAGQDHSSVGANVDYYLLFLLRSTLMERVCRSCCCYLHRKTVL
ncbi:Alpha/Beta hydrolase protein [Triangularia setosa]|uniref:Alpha/Beta hydrolase protein n=1 Tax=Triangularia setosa TaxID=2587417 RepID=A0AAN6VXW4_9PEZI|nr:Alpha/Beta hydrolase protein [Podospora setosa]